MTTTADAFAAAVLAEVALPPVLANAGATKTNLKPLLFRPGGAPPYPWQSEGKKPCYFAQGRHHLTPGELRVRPCTYIFNVSA